MPLRHLVAVLAAAHLAGCGEDAETVYPHALAGGTYHVAGAGGAAANLTGLSALTARLDRAAETLVLTEPDGTVHHLGVAFGPREAWIEDCHTMSSHALDEWAVLSPAPLTIGSVEFTAPVVYAKCSDERMILSESPAEAEPWIAFDLD